MISNHGGRQLDGCEDRKISLNQIVKLLKD